MNINQFVSLTIISAMALSCSLKEESIPNSPIPQGAMTFNASFADANESKTAVQEDGNTIWWSPGDAINVFYGNLSSGVFYGNNKEAAPQTSFTGNLTALMGSMEYNADAMSFWAVYPYNASNTCDGSSVTLTIPALQDGADNSFADGVFPAIAKSEGLNLSFYNLCGGVMFTVESSDITSVTLSGNNGESLAGKVKADFKEGLPSILNVVTAENSVKLLAPNHATFTPGVRYYITAIPGTLSKGFTLLFKKGSLEGRYVRSESADINRSRFRVVNNADSGIEFTPGTPDSKIIQFADDNLKLKLVAAFDTDSDGELSYEEASAVTDGNALKEAFEGQINFTSFNELQYFTGISSLPDRMFEGWAKMTSLIIPDNVKSYGSYAFYGCTKLGSPISIPYGMTKVPYECFYECVSIPSITIPDTVTEISSDAFNGCKSLTHIEIPDGVKEIRSYAFSYCESLQSIILPPQITTIYNCVFQHCSSLTSIVIPDGVTSINWNAFSYCTNLKSVILPGSLMKIESSAFTECRKLSSITIPKNITSIDDRAFCYCEGLSHITLLATEPPVLGTAAFDGSSCLIYVPSGSVDAYKAEQSWSKYVSRICSENKRPSEAYAAWLGRWTTTRGSSTDTWIVSTDKVEESFTIIGVEGHNQTGFAVKADFNPSDGSMSISEQSSEIYMDNGVETNRYLMGYLEYNGGIYYYGEGATLAIGKISDGTAQFQSALVPGGNYGYFTIMRFVGIQNNEVKGAYSSEYMSIPFTLSRD